EILQHLDVPTFQDFGIDTQRHDLESATDYGRDHPATGAGFDGPRSGLLLHLPEAFLQLLRLLHDVAERTKSFAHSVPRARRARDFTSCTSPPKISTAARTTGSPSAELCSSTALSTGATADGSAALAAWTVTRSGRPKNFSAKS